MTLELRRSLTLVQRTHREGGKDVADPTLLVAAMAIIRNPWFGRGHVEDLGPEIRAQGPVLGRLLHDAAAQAKRGADHERKRQSRQFAIEETNVVEAVRFGSKQKRQMALETEFAPDGDVKDETGAKEHSNRCRVSKDRRFQGRLRPCGLPDRSAAGAHGLAQNQFCAVAESAITASAIDCARYPTDIGPPYVQEGSMEVNCPERTNGMNCQIGSANRVSPSSNGSM